MSTVPMDPYQVLGVSKDAQVGEIRQAHRKLVLKCHPDKIQDPELKAQKQDEFQRVQQAYEILSDDKERQKYDDKIRLAELRQQFQNNKANTSATRSSPKTFEVRTADPGSRSYPTAPAGVKMYATFSRSYEEPDRRSGTRYHDAEIRIPRREQTFPEKPSKRESERDREKDKDKERRRIRKERELAEEIRRAEKMAKKEEKRARDKQRSKDDKQRSKDHKREKEEKRRDRGDAYIESFDEEEPDVLPRMSSKKYEERRERSAPRDETPPRDYETYVRSQFARAYIDLSRDTGAERAQMYNMHSNQPPAVPSPPPSIPAPYAAPPNEEEIRRSSAKPRRGSSDMPSSLPKERIYRSSREPMDDVYEDHIINASPAARSARRFSGGGPAPEMASSPPRGISRTHTMPTEIPARPIPAPRRSQTYNDPYGASPEYAVNRGRHRSKNTPQVPVESSDDDEEYERHRRPKHRSSRRTRSPDQIGAETRYYVDGNRTTKLHSYSRRLDNEQPAFHYEDGAPPQRPAYYRQTSYVNTTFPKVRTSKAYRQEDIQFSNYSAPRYPEGVPTHA